MKTVWFIELTAALLTCTFATGCAEHERVSLGRASNLTIDLGTCLDTDCRSPEVATDSHEEATAVLCDPGMALQLGLSWEQVPEPVACEELGECTLRAYRMALARDGSLWVVASISTPEFDGNVGGLWLARHSSDGQRTSAEILELTVGERHQDVDYEHSVAVDGRGHLFMAVHKTVSDADGNESDSRWVAEYGPDGSQLGEQMPFAGAGYKPLIATSGRDAIVLSESEVSSGIARIGTDRVAHWTQNGTRTDQPFSLVSDAEGRVSVFGRRFGRVTSADAWAIEHYDAQGRLVWDHTFDHHLENAELAIDRDGNLIRAGYVGASNGPASYELWVHKIDPRGRSVWLTRFPLPPDVVQGWGESARAAADAEGNLFMAGWASGDEASRQVIYEFSASGDFCQLYESSNPEATVPTQLIASDDGALYFATQDGYGRFAR